VNCYGRVNKGGGAWGPISCTSAAWEARILPNRVKIFQHLLNDNDIVVSIDSVHWNIDHTRLSFMASFCPRVQRSESALKIKCIAQAYGLTRTTHWANLGQISGFNFGSEWNSIPDDRLKAVSSNWRGFGYVNGKLPPINTNVKNIKNVITKIAESMTHDEAVSCLDESVSRWL